MRLQLVVGLVLVTGAAAQVPESKPVKTSSTALHRAWMQEVLDLDSAGAIERYAEVAADDRPFHFARWIAVARLAELQRMQVASGPKLPTNGAPIALRARLSEYDGPLEVTDLLERVSAAPKALLDDFATKQLRLPPLRPFVLIADSWAVDQIGPSRIDRFRRRLAAPDTRPPLTSRVFAARVLGAELYGRTEQAEGLRSLYFATWVAPTAAADPAVDVERIRHNIEELLQEREWTGGWGGLHRLLRRRFEEVAAEDPAAAVALVLRVPQYAERLLRPVPAEKR